MERLICGADVADAQKASGKTSFCEFAMAVKKGHGECGDSAFVYSGKDTLVAAVFDGVSGEPGASFASSDAAAAVLEHLKGVEKPGEAAMKEALTKAHLAIRLGSTTATILHMDKRGAFMMASIGDSPAYSINGKGRLSLEMPLARLVGDNDSILKFFYFRNMVTSVLGFAGDLNVHIRSGTLKKGEIIILASDGLSDNLFMEVKGGFVTDSSGKKDLAAIVGKLRSPASIVKKLLSELKRRIRLGKKEGPGKMLIPKADDIAIIAVRRL
jgi:serine/threonine protein phosphatase PrpC